MIKDTLGRIFRRRFPTAMRLYRDARDRRAATHIRDTPHGLRLSGPDRMVMDLNWERHQVELFRTKIPAVDVFVDVGANLGIYTCLAARAGKRVVAIEPLPANLYFLFANIRANGLQNIEVFPVGLSDRIGLMDLYGWRDVASFVEGWFDAPSSLTTTVPVTTLDELVARRFSNFRLLIKIDVEGHEHAVLRGAADTLRLTPRPCWIVEVLVRQSTRDREKNPYFSECFDYFWRNGYSAFRIGGSEAVVTPTQVRQWYDAGQLDGVGSSNFLFRSN